MLCRNTLFTEIKRNILEQCKDSQQLEDSPSDPESIVDGTSIAIAIVMTFALTAAAVLFLSLTLGLVLHKRSAMKREKNVATNGDLSMNDYDDRKSGL